MSTVLSVVFLAAVAFFAGRMALAGQITVGELVAVVGLAQFVQEPMSRTGFLGVELAQKRASARRLLLLLGEPTVHSPVDGAASAAHAGHPRRPRGRDRDDHGRLRRVRRASRHGPGGPGRGQSSCPTAATRPGSSTPSGAAPPPHPEPSS